ncbi:sensor domain-containing diguanylate cyclase [Vibrio navarrensis]|uniref:sensor domain-containing diguanylate cyclase n=1 Tax=Vibrio navarrensis TaxID=29495 RepID=UPI0018DE8EE8|nr:sensor domain-containing diguanylate cyclase [Vibrio navarrensis]MBH9742255.1 diguanylate cyclase [Vibrio navarrensis]
MDRLNLRKLILSLGIFGVLITLFNTFYSIYNVQRELIIRKTIDSNRVYAEKMAEMTDGFLDSALSQLKFSASLLSTEMKSTDILDIETDRLRLQTDSFNSVVIVNSEGIIISVSPETIQVKGIKLKGERELQSLKAQAPTITNPFISPAGNYLTSISYPIFTKSGEYLGYIGGTIYLEKENILTTLLGKHTYKDGSYISVVDRNGTLIYHPDRSRVGQNVYNEAIVDVLKGEQGGKDIFNSQGVEMLTGYAPVKESGWGIIVQKSKELTLAALDEQMRKVFISSLPVGIITLFLIWISSVFISRPLWQLASAVRNSNDHAKTMINLKQIKPWYFEASHLRSSFLRTFSIVSNTIDRLNIESLTDALTGLLNRRGLERALEKFNHDSYPISALALDIDYFKNVNDTFGHNVGDELLINISTLMKAQAREQDIVCRAGGEEFIVFLQRTDLKSAFDVAERVRKAVEEFNFPSVGHVTISIGISCALERGAPMESIIKNADEALYIAKKTGRNKTVTS